MTTDEVLLGVGLIVALAVGSQVLASRLKIPALILLLPAAVILYDAGMSGPARRNPSPGTPGSSLAGRSRLPSSAAGEVRAPGRFQDGECD